MPTTPRDCFIEYSNSKVVAKEELAELFAQLAQQMLRNDISYLVRDCDQGGNVIGIKADGRIITLLARREYSSEGRSITLVRSVSYVRVLHAFFSFTGVLKIWSVCPPSFLIDVENLGPSSRVPRGQVSFGQPAKWGFYDGYVRYRIDVSGVSD